jgi:hypothetical protein
MVTEGGKPILAITLSRLRIWARLFFGEVFNLAGVPGLVRECRYGSTATTAEITVKHGRLFTVISVNGLDIYFHRLTGSIDGVGTTDSISESVPQSTALPVLSESVHHNVRK